MLSSGCESGLPGAQEAWRVRPGRGQLGPEDRELGPGWGDRQQVPLAQLRGSGGRFPEQRLRLHGDKEKGDADSASGPEAATALQGWAPSSGNLPPVTRKPRCGARGSQAPRSTCGPFWGSWWG